MNDKNNKLNAPKFKFNMYWIYGAIFVVFIGISFLNDSTLSTKKISTNEFFKVFFLPKRTSSFKPQVDNSSNSGLYKTTANQQFISFVFTVLHAVMMLFKIIICCFHFFSYSLLLQLHSLFEITNH